MSEMNRDLDAIDFFCAQFREFCEDVEKEEVLNHVLIEQIMTGLSETERTLIDMRYFKDKTQTEVAAVCGISQVQVSRLEKKILLKLREKMSMKKQIR